MFLIGGFPMRRWIAPLIYSLLASTSVFASVTLHVTVKNESAEDIDGAIVYALVFTNNGPCPVSYTHLDVYKRQGSLSPAS